MNRRKVISYIIGLCGAGAVPAVVQAASKSDQIDYERYGKALVEETIALNRYISDGRTHGSAKCDIWIKSSIALDRVRKEIKEKYV